MEQMIELYIIFALGISAGFLYRKGGQGLPWNTKHRDIGVPLVVGAEFLFLGYFNWQLLILMLLVFGSLTTYWTPKSYPRVLWWNWALTGFFYGLSLFPMVFVTGNWYGFITIVFWMSLLTCGFSEFFKNVEWEEGMRGFLIVLIVYILFK